jgi:hypothetical protein
MAERGRGADLIVREVGLAIRLLGNILVSMCTRLAERVASRRRALLTRRTRAPSFDTDFRQDRKGSEKPGSAGPTSQIVNFTVAVFWEL